MIALGGGNEIGASCYAIQLGNNHFLLDAGIRINRNFSYASRFPDMKPLFEQWNLNSLNELDALFISHAHLDHMGALPSLIRQLGNVHIYSSHATPELMSAQYEDIKSMAEFSSIYTEDSRNVSIASDYIIPVSLGKIITLRDVRASFIHAGHIPGAVMILLEDENRRILYTGDFCASDMFTVKAMNIPSDIGKIDTLICESTLGYNTQHRITSELPVKRICSILENKHVLFFIVKSVGMASEIALALRTYSEAGIIPDVDVWIDTSCEKGCLACEKWSRPVFGPHVKRIDSRKNIDDVRGIIIQSYSPEEGSEIIYGNQCGLYNHADRYGILKLVTAIEPERIIFIHGVPEYNSRGSIVDDIRSHFGALIDIHHAENGIELKI